MASRVKLIASMQLIIAPGGARVLLSKTIALAAVVQWTALLAASAAAFARAVLVTL